jgi:hypothetical protein
LAANKAHLNKVFFEAWLMSSKRTCSDLRRTLIDAGIAIHSRASKAELEALVQQHLPDDGVRVVDDDCESEGGAEPSDLLAVFEDETDIVDALRLLKQGYIEKVTRKGYENMQKKLFVWLHEKQNIGKHQCIKLQFSPSGSPIGIEGIMVKKKVLRADSEVEMEELCDLTSFPVGVFMEFILSLESSTLSDNITGKPMLIGKGGLAGYRKAFNNLFVEKGLQQPPSMVQELKVYFAALKRRDAHEKAVGARPVSEGKEAIPYAVYVKVCQEFFKSGHFFELLYATLCWNLMCRTENTAMISIEHLTMLADAIGVKFSQQKCDKTGDELPSHYRRIYSGSGCISVGVALALYLITNPSLGEDGKMLFPGSPGSQKKRFSESLNSLFEQPHMKMFLTSHGLSPRSFGSHSFRKGAATFATSGCTGGPSLLSVCIRAGWAVGGVLDRYIKFDAKGDAFLGRVLAGFDLSSSDFGSATPHFKGCALRSETLHAIFPVLSQYPKFTPICTHALACLIQHDSIILSLPADNECRKKVLMSRLYRDPLELQRLRELVSVEADTEITGVPEFTHMLSALLKLVKQMGDLPSQLCVDLGQVMDAKGAAAGNITEARVKELLAEQKVEILQGIEGMMSRTAVDDNAQRSPSVLDPGNNYKGYLWCRANDKLKQQRFHMLPEGFKLPGKNFNARTMWGLWWQRCADMTNLVVGSTWDGFYLPPLRRVCREDFSNLCCRKRFGEYKCLLLQMEESVKVSDAGLFNEMEESFLKVPTQVSDSMIQKSWDLCKHIIQDLLLGGNCKKTASKRSSQVAFSTAVWYRMGGSNKCKAKKRTRREGS